MPSTAKNTSLNYNPFGSAIESRAFASGEYRFGMNGQEKDDEIYGEGNSYSAEYWQYDGRLGRRWNVDPVVKVHESPYAAFANNSIWFIDPNGADTIYASKNTETGKWDITKTQLAKGDDVFRITYGDHSKQFVFSEGENGKRINVLNIESKESEGNDKKGYTLGIYHISGQEGEGATGFAVTPEGSSSTKESSGKRLPDDTYTLNGTDGHSDYKWVQPLIHTGTNGGHVGGRGVKIHPTPSKSPETKANRWTAGCYVVCTDYSLKGGTVYYKSKLSIKTSKQINTMLGATKHYDAVGKKSRPGSDFGNGIQFKLIQKTGF